VRKFMVLACVFGLFAGLAMAAETENYPKAEFFGGYQYSRLEGGVNANGFGFALNGNFNNYFGITADFGSAFTTQSGVSIHNYSYTFGPQLSLRANKAYTPFVHALDSVRGTAHCIGFAWHGSQNGLWNIQLRLGGGGRTLAFRNLRGKRLLSIDTRTFRVSYTGMDHTGRTLSPLWFALTVPILILLAAARFHRRRLLASAPRWRTSASSG